LASRGPGRPQIWAGLAGVCRSDPLLYFFSVNRFFPFSANDSKIQKLVENILGIQKL
jgi:hypothetical protein